MSQPSTSENLATGVVMAGTAAGLTGFSMLAINLISLARGKEGLPKTWTPGTEFGNFNISAVCLLMGGFLMAQLATLYLRSHKKNQVEEQSPASQIKP